MDKDLILEIGTEEIPAGFLKNSASSLKENAAKTFFENNLPFDEISVFYTPRRLTMRVTGIPGKQEDINELHMGPPQSIAYDSKGNPTKAAIGFAKKFGTDTKKLSLTENEKGKFLTFTKKVKGRKSAQILKEILAELILRTPFPKSMRWRTSTISYARPIRWILCIFNGRPVRFEIYNIKSSDKSYGHRFLSPRSFKVTDWTGYTSSLTEAYIMLDQHQRASTIRQEVQAKAETLGGFVQSDEDLMQTVTNIVEYPVALTGSFEQDYLEIPPEVLVSVMKTHQKYFPVYKNQSTEPDIDSVRSLSDIKRINTLMPHFIFISGMKVEKPDVISKGNERVIRARFNDARFFLTEDTKQPLDCFLEKLKAVTYLSKVGSYLDKKTRLEKLAGQISEQYSELDTNTLCRAAELCKADLVTQMVFEFPELQGIMGRYYALISGECTEVARAVHEHYMPVTRDGDLPESIAGSFLSIIEKADNICSCFYAGLIPTGSADPYALRRQAIGIIRIVIDKNINLDINGLVNNWIENCGLDITADTRSNLITEICSFMRERLRNYLLETYSFDFDVVDAVLAVNYNNIIDALNIIKAISDYKQQQDFESVTTAFKRVVNITKNSVAGQVNPSLFTEPQEKQLHDHFLTLRESVIVDFENCRYQSVLSKVIELRVPVDNFFDSVMVMDKNLQIKNNRLLLLGEIKDLFFKIADFSKLN